MFVTKVVWLRKPSGYTDRLVTQAVWLHKLFGGTGRLVTQAAIWLHRPPFGYTGRRLVTQAAVCLHKLFGYIGRLVARILAQAVPG